MKKKILLIPLLFSAFVVAGCSTSGGGGGGSDPEPVDPVFPDLPTKHTDTINLNNYEYYFEVIPLYFSNLLNGYEFHGAIPGGIYDCQITIANDKASKTFKVAASGFASETITVGSGYGTPKVTVCTGTVSYWF